MLNSLCVVEPPVVHAHFWWIKTFPYRIQFHVSPPKGKSCGSFHNLDSTGQIGVRPGAVGCGENKLGVWLGVWVKLLGVSGSRQGREY